VSLRRAPVSRPVSVSRSQGDPLVEPLATVAAGVLATARRNAALFGVGRDSMYRIGPFVQLLDKSPDPFLSPDNARDDVRLDNAMSFAGVRTSSGFVPARIAGTIGGGAVADGTALAIAVSGHIRAMTRSYEFNGQTRFEALVPETSFHDGDNAVAIYAVSRTGDALRLSRLGGTPPRANVLLTAATAPVRRAAGPKRP
jgi:hypothetical protein